MASDPRKILADRYSRPGFRSLPDKPMPSLYGSPLSMLKQLSKYSSEELGVPTGLPYKQSKEDLWEDYLKRWSTFETRHPDAYQFFADEIPKDIEERLSRAHDLGFRVPGSRGMHKREVDESFDFSPREVQISPYLPNEYYKPRTRMGRHADLNQDLIGPVAGHFGGFARSVPVPLLMRTHPNSTLVVTDTEANDPVDLASKLTEEDMMSTKDWDNIFGPQGTNIPDESSKLMRQWLLDNGYNSLIYPNEVEGSPELSSSQEMKMTGMGNRAKRYLEQMPFAQRLEGLGDIPNPSIVMLDPADIRHQAAEFRPEFSKKVGYRLAIPAAGALGVYSLLNSDGAQAAEEEKIPPSVAPHGVDDWYETATDAIDRNIGRGSAAGMINDAMRSSWWGSGLSETALDLMAYPINAGKMGINRLRESQSENTLGNTQLEMTPDLESLIGEIVEDTTGLTPADEGYYEQFDKVKGFFDSEEERREGERQEAILKRQGERSPVYGPRGPFENFVKTELPDSAGELATAVSVFDTGLRAAAHGVKKGYESFKKNKRRLGKIFTGSVEAVN